MDEMKSLPEGDAETMHEEGSGNGGSARDAGTTMNKDTTIQSKSIVDERNGATEIAQDVFLRDILGREHMILEIGRKRRWNTNTATDMGNVVRPQHLLVRGRMIGTNEQSRKNLLH
jgi:hypothetical protein